MANIYGGNSGTGQTQSKYKAPKIGSGGGSIAPDVPSGGGAAPASSGGKLYIDLTDPAGSLNSAASSLGDFAAGVGSIGIPGGPNLGGVAATAGAPFGAARDALDSGLQALGGIELPYAGDDPTKTNAHLGDVPGAIGEGLGLAGKGLERTIAGQRVTGGPLADFSIEDVLPFGGIQKGLRAAAGQGEGEALPPDLQERLDNGESVDKVADELVARGAGYSSDPIRNLTSEFVLDPMNFVGGFAARGAGALAKAGMTLKTADEVRNLGLSTRVAGTTYNAVTRGLSGAGAAFVDKAIGPVTSGALHTLGTGSLGRFRSGFGRLSKGYALAIDDAAGYANANLLNQVIVDEIMSEANIGRKFTGTLGETVATRLAAKMKVAPGQLERRAQELLQRVAPTTYGVDDVAGQTARRMALVTDSSIEDAARLVGSKVSKRAFQTADFLLYGKAGNDLEAAKAAALASAKKGRIDIDRLTVVSRDTLDKDTALELAADLKTDYAEAINRYPILGNRFLGKNPSADEVRDFLGQLIDKDALPTLVKEATTKRNALPSVLGDWRQKYGEFYALGFRPKADLTLIDDAAGNPSFVKPFIEFPSTARPVTARNPLGRTVDALFRGIGQTTIVQEARERFTDAIVAKGLPIAPDQARGIFKAIIDEAAERGVTPRALARETVATGAGEARRVESVYDAAFRRFLSPEQYDELTARVDPTFLVMKAFRGNWRTVGLTQGLTGSVKATRLVGPGAAAIAENVYPKMRFTLNPLFQAQELIESPVWNGLRGVLQRPMAADLAEAYKGLAELPEFKYMTEAGYFLNIAGGKSFERFVGQNDKLGRALSRFADIQSRKGAMRVAQVLAEHGEEFKGAVQQINPKLWRTMEEAYGTTDPRLIADKFLTERMALTSGDLEEVTKAFDAAKPAGAFEGPAGETVWQAFRDSFRQSSAQAFKTHFFTPERGWLERSVNHPFLGLYPLSYMLKVASEFSRFLLARPFGLKAPLAGAAALERTQQAFMGAYVDDPDFRKWLDDNKDATYLANLLLPGQPTQLGAGLPAWARHISGDLAQGKAITGDTITREAMDTASYSLAAPVNAFNTTVAAGADIGSMAQDVFANLERAAREYDGQFPIGSQRP